MKQRLFSAVLSKRRLLLALFAGVFLASFFLSGLVSVNYDMTDYLPEDTASTRSLEKMKEEFTGGIPSVRVMIRDVSVPEALEYKTKLKALTGVISVSWLDDAADITVPLSSLDAETLENYYREGAALYSVTVEEDHRLEAVSEIRSIVGDRGALTGTAVSTADATLNTVSEVRTITLIAVVFVFFVLLFTTESWLEPLIVLVGLGVAIMINNGTNLIFGEISFVTNAAGSVLQLAVSLDYSVFLLHRYHECQRQSADASEAMAQALSRSASSILSSGLTTVIGFLALVLMRFQLGADLGLALAKGVAISLLTVFFFLPALIVVLDRPIEKMRHKPLLPAFEGFGRFVRRILPVTVCIFVVLLVPSYLASNANTYLYGSSQIFGEDTRYGKDSAAVESVFGKSDTYVLLVPKGDTALQTALSDELKALPEVTGVISYVDLAGAEVPRAYLDEDTLAQLEGAHYSRMVLNVDVPYEGAETFSLIEKIRSISGEYYPGDFYLAGEGVSTYDLKETITADMLLVNLLAIGAVFVILLLMLKSVSLPVILVLSIETAVWLNLAIPYFSDQPIYYLAYLIISSVQLGATVDYAILMSDRYREERALFDKKEAVVRTLSEVFVSIMTSGSALTVVGFLLGFLSSNGLIAQLGVFIGRGALISILIVLFVLPGLLYLCDGLFTGMKKKRKADAA